MTRETCWTSIPRAQTSVVMSTRLQWCQNLSMLKSTKKSARCGTAEFCHDGISFLLNHLTVHRRHGEVCCAHLFSQPIDLFRPISYTKEGSILKAYLAPGVAKDNGLCNGECVVQITQRVELPVLFFYSHKKLFDPFER